jgi:hypothetical protein
MIVRLLKPAVIAGVQKAPGARMAFDDEREAAALIASGVAEADAKPDGKPEKPGKGAGKG